MNRPVTREQMTTILQSILWLVVFVVLLQVWLLTATLNAWMGGDDTVLWPAAAASVVCALVNFGLLRYLNRLAV
jgi:preprotein translocase subunit SecE